MANSWTHILARVAVRPLVGGPITPDNITTARLVTGIAACLCFAVGGREWDIWGGVLWLVSAFLDRADGELARLSNSCNPAGHAYDYACDVAVNALFFVGIGIGARAGMLGPWAIALGLLAGGGIALASIWSEWLEKEDKSGRKAYEGVAGFDFDDVLYLFAPIAWLGWLTPLLIGGAIGGPIFAVVTWVRWRRAMAAAQTSPRKS